MHKGDVLFGKRNAYLRRTAIAPHDGLFSAHGMILKPNEKIVDKNFFPMFISSDYFFDVAIKISVGSLSPTVNWRDLARQEFKLPPLELQNKFTDFVEQADKSKLAIQETLENLKAMQKNFVADIFS